MSGMLHPVGPEPARTYWIRRGILVAIVLGLALGVVLAVANLTKAAVATAPPPAVLPADSPSPSPGTGDSTGAATPSGSAAAPSAIPSASASTQPSSSASGSASAPSTTEPNANPSARSTTSPSAQPRPTTSTVGTPHCQPAALRVTLEGDRSLNPGQKNRFRLSLVNSGRQTCRTSVTDKNFELKIYSGTDRIWSSRDCAKTLADFDKLLAARADVDWTMTWNGKRSVKGSSCKNGSETPQAGTYWATAQLTGADPVQLRMIIG